MSARDPVLEMALSKAVVGLRRDTRMDLVFGGPSAGGGRAVLLSFAGNLGASLHGLQVEAGRGLGGRALATGTPARVSDYPGARNIVHSYDRQVSPEKIRSVVAVPVTIEGRTAGLLYLAARHVIELGTRAVGIAVAAARRVERDVLIERTVQQRIDGARHFVASSFTGKDARQALLAITEELRDLQEHATDHGVRDRLERITRRLDSIAEPAASSIRSPAAALSPRELDVLQHVAVGRSNDQIAVALGLTTGTVKAYLKGATCKLGAQNRAHAAHLARASGLIR